MTEEFDLSEEIFDEKQIIKEADLQKGEIEFSMTGELIPLEKVEVVLKEFIKRDYDLINLLITEEIDFREFMIRRNKLIGEKLLI